MHQCDSATLVEFDRRRLDELVPMWRASFEAGVGIVNPHPLDKQRRYFLTQVLPHNDVRLATRGDELVGFVAASAESVSQLYVAPGRQRCGVGTLLLNWAKEHSHGTLWLFTFARNLNARAFYESQGFRAIAHGFEPTWQLDDIKYSWIRGTHLKG